MPVYITGDGDPYRPGGLFWLDATGSVVGSTVTRPEELLAVASDSLQTAIDRPLVGRPRSPDRVRVASRELAEILRQAHPSIDIVCAPTPELDQLFEVLHEQMEEDVEAEQSYLSPGLGPAEIASFFQATADLHRAGPWKTIPSDQDLFSVAIPELDLHSAAISIVGQAGIERGVLLFADVADFAAFVQAADAIDRGEAPPTLPGHLSLTYERASDLADGCRREIAEHGWTVASSSAVPWLVAVDDEIIARPPTPREVAIFEAIARALPVVLSGRKALLAAWNGGKPVKRTFKVPTHAGDLTVTLRAPPEADRRLDRTPDNVGDDANALAVLEAGSIGRWHLVETDLWGEDSIDLLEQAHIELGPDGLGHLVVGALQADLDYRTSRRDGDPIVEFSWIGDDDLHPASGRGWARLDAQRGIRVKLYIHRGDEATMIGVPMDAPEATGARARKPASRGRRR